MNFTLRFMHFGYYHLTAEFKKSRQCAPTWRELSLANVNLTMFCTISRLCYKPVLYLWLLLGFGFFCIWSAHWVLTYLSAAWQMVPHVSAMSSTRMATRSLTSPTSTIRSTSLAFLRSLWMSANSTFSRSAMEVTLRTYFQAQTQIITFKWANVMHRLHLTIFITGRQQTALPETDLHGTVLRFVENLVL